MRLNVDESFFGDERFTDLVALVGCRYRAIGICIYFWKLSFRYWKDDCGLIPLQVFQRYTEWRTLVEVGLAEQKGDFVYAKGSEDRFSWILQKIEAGKRGAKKTNELRYGAAQRALDENNLRFDAARPPAPAPAPALKKIEKKKRQTKPLIKTWPADHLYAKIFENLNRIPAYREIFDFPDDESTILRHMERYCLTASDMEQVTYELAEWANNPKNQMTSPRGRLNTFCKTTSEKRKKNKGTQYQLFNGEI